MLLTSLPLRVVEQKQPWRSHVGKCPCTTTARQESAKDQTRVARRPTRGLSDILSPPPITEYPSSILSFATMSQNLTDEDQKELSTFLDAEQAKARVQSTVHAFTERCWDQCVKSSIGSHFGRGEEACLSNCVERYVHAII